MLAEDIKPNRMERANMAVSRLIDQLADDRIGITIFAGECCYTGSTYQ
jgi:Ca-activated chloride channel homolog